MNADFKDSHEFAFDPWESLKSAFIRVLFTSPNWLHGIASRTHTLGISLAMPEAQSAVSRLICRSDSG
jgi:hypothetical protein